MPQFQVVFILATLGVAIAAGYEGYLGNMGSACLLGVLVLLAVSLAVTREPEVRQSRALLVSFISGLSVLACVSNLAPHPDNVLNKESKLLKVTEGILLGYMAVHSLTEYAYLQAMADEQDRRELFTRLSGFFSRYDAIRAPSPQPQFRAFTGHGFKVANDTS